MHEHDLVNRWCTRTRDIIDEGPRENWRIVNSFLLKGKINNGTRNAPVRNILNSKRGKWSFFLSSSWIVFHWKAPNFWKTERSKIKTRERSVWWINYNVCKSGVFAYAYAKTNFWTLRNHPDPICAFLSPCPYNFAGKSWHDFNFTRFTGNRREIYENRWNVATRSTIFNLDSVGKK